ncbi:MAG: hypothetical protein AB7G37_05035 [Solirubrobacteraceae bacterium]
MTSLKSTTREQDAVRLLMLLRWAPDSSLPDEAPAEAVACIGGEQRLQAMDFWLRNPDYLAEEYLERVAEESDAWEIAKRIVQDEEPDLRTYPMLRYRYGAWERLDDSLGLLRTYGLATDRRAGDLQQGRRDFFLLERGAAASDQLGSEIPELAWYAERAKLVRRIAGDEGGTALKLRQKLQDEYLDTAWHDQIASIRPRVLARIQELAPA